MSRYEITADEKAMTITVGSAVFTSPQLWRQRETDFEFKAQICGADEERIDDLKARHKFYADRLGPKFNLRFYAANYWLWLGNRMRPSTADMLRFTGSRWRVYSPVLVKRANDVLPLVHEAERDELHHLIPAIIIFGASPHDIKHKIGAGTWKRIAHNSKTRNKRIMQAVQLFGMPEWGERFVRLLDVPSGVLGAIGAADEDDMIAARVTPRKTSMGFVQTLHVVRDARRMLGHINPEWSFARIQREHDEAAKGIRSKKFSDKPFEEDWSFEKDGFCATLLTSPLAIALEGDTQHHCVGSYAREAADGRYAVLRIEGKERATAGLTKTGFGWHLNQVYAACNAPVSEPCHKFADAAAKAFTQHSIAELRREAA